MDDHLSVTLAELEHHLVATLLSPQASQQYQSGAIAHAELHPFISTIQSLSARYVTTPDSRKLPTITTAEAAAYALYYLPINFAKLFQLAAHLPAPRNALRILDVGCGPGTGALALCARANAVPSTAVTSVTLVDSSAAMLTVAKKLLAAYRPAVPVTATATIPTSGTFDLIIAANYLNELPEPQRVPTTETLLSLLDSAGSLMMVEPALQHTTRALMQLRDKLLSDSPELEVVFPCTHAQPCPMLQANPNDWCHGTMSWSPPRLVAQIDELSGFNKHRLKYACLIVTKRSRQSRPTQLRVISEATRSRIGHSALVCGEQFYGTLTLPKRARRDHNHHFTHLQSFDLIEVQPPPSSATLAAEATVSLARPSRTVATIP